ncbi:MAG: cell division transport system permease protein [Lentisphaeria bacterium]|jgi:cell division transport system permease protein
MSRGASRNYIKPGLTKPGLDGQKPLKGAAKLPPSKGAVQSKTSFSDRSSSYWAHHRSSLRESLQRLLASPVQSLMTSLVVAIALALPTTLLMALNNVAQLGQSWDASPKISVYIKLRAKEAAVQNLIETVEGYAEVERVDYLSPQQALDDFQRFSGFGQALSSLDDNPLPATVIITPKNTALLPANLKLLGDRIRTQAIVDEVGLDMAWVRRLQQMMLLGRQIVLALAVLLSVGVLIAIGNTIRLAIENRREEILVTKLVGGTNSFVRRPFLYSGSWYGFFGGLLACLIVGLGYLALEPSVQRLASLYHSDFELQGLGWWGALRLIVLSTFIGWLGAGLAVGRHLSHIEPR